MKVNKALFIIPLYFHDNRHDHRTSLGLFPDEITQSIFYFIFDLAPIGNVVIHTIIHGLIENGFCFIHQTLGITYKDETSRYDMNRKLVI